LDALADSIDAHDPHLQATLQSAHERFAALASPNEETLLPIPVDEITRAMGVVTLDDSSDTRTSDHATIIQPSPLDSEKNLVAYAVLKLMEFSIESTALGIFLMHNETVIAKTGALTKATWEQIFEAVYSAWQREGDSYTRLLYRGLENIGESLIFSTSTVDDLKLTMIFAADTPLRIIRRQAARITEALLNFSEGAVEEQIIPSDSSSELSNMETLVSPLDEETPVLGSVALVPENNIPTDIYEVESEPARTLPSRPTDLKPPPDFKEAIGEITPPERPVGTYTDYGCVWLLQEIRVDIQNQYQYALQQWIKRICVEREWDIIALEIGAGWVNLHISIPIKTLPNDVLFRLMHETNAAMQEVLGRNADAYPSIWYNSYIINTPGRLLPNKDIDRFIRFSVQQRPV
jgi:hypothetical protein